MKQIPIPSPPPAEQERIVARIEEMFSQLDASVAELKTAKERLGVYRQAVLKEAFDLCPEEKALSSVCIHITDGDHMPPPKSKTGIPFIMISNIHHNRINWSNTANVDRKYYANIDEKRRPQNGDVLYTGTGSFGIPVLVDYNKLFCFQRHIALLRPNKSIYSEVPVLCHARSESIFPSSKKSYWNCAKNSRTFCVKGIKDFFYRSY